MRTKWSEYNKGAFCGLLGYLISRPLDQMELARSEIKANENKIISRIEASRIVIKHDGFRGLYKNESIFAPLSATLYRSIYFGLWHRLKMKSDNKYLHNLVFSFMAAFGASLATMIPDKCRNFMFRVNEERSKSIERKYRKTNVELKPVVGELI